MLKIPADVIKEQNPTLYIKSIRFYFCLLGNISFT